MARRYFEPVRFPKSACETLSRLHGEGFVVHVMRTTAWVNYLYLSWALVKHGLPPVRAVVNLRRWFTKPWIRTAQRGEFDVRFTYARKHQGSGLVFLKETVLGVAGGRVTEEDPFPALVEMAKRSERPVFLVPELFVWEKWNQKIAPSLFDRLFGSPEAPGFLHTLFTFLRNYHRAQFRLGEPIDLKKFVAQNPDVAPDVLARKVRSALHHHLARETRAVFGPPAKSTERLIEETLRDRTLKRSLEEAQLEKSRSIDSITREAKRNLQSIAARYSPSVVAVASPVLDWVFNRIYDGIDVDEPGLERAMKAAAHAPVVLTPSHKSHVDYLVMSYVLWYRGYSVPLVAAGANLSFFPLGPFLRRGGAFFLRRSFKDDPIYTATFKAYIKKLVHDGIHHEFFPEGGRSRNGKLLQPKLGMFSWQVDAVLEGARDDLLFVPVAIDYEKVVESSSYGEELRGGEKKAEGVGQLLQAPKVLSENYGRIHLSFAEPISLAALMRERRLDRKESVTEEQKRSLVRALGHHVMYGISRVSTVTPHALLASALLAHRRRGISAKDVGERIVFLRQIATDLGARISRQMEGAPSAPSTLGPICDALAMFASQGMVKTVEALGEPIYQVEDDKRAEMAFYKNTLINLVAGRTIVACAIVSTPLDALTVIRERALLLSRLFKFELTYPVGKTFEVIFAETVEHLSRLGVVLADQSTLRPAPEPFARPMLAFLADLIRDYLESYWLAAKLAANMPVQGMDKKEFVKATLERGRGEFLAGSLTAAEALSRTNLENAVQYLVDQKVLVEQDKKLTAQASSAKALMETIRSYLGE
jgi:glycerol-3-phosphate O-acyltransferase